MTTTTRPRQRFRDEQEGHDVLTHARDAGRARPDDHDQAHQSSSAGAPTGALAALLGLVPGRRGPDHELPCRSGPADLWFAELPHEVEEAKALCVPCPVRESCLRGALERAEPWGVWGGQLVLQGVVVPRKRPRGRPRKNDVAA